MYRAFCVAELQAGVGCVCVVCGVCGVCVCAGNLQSSQNNTTRSVFLL